MEFVIEDKHFLFQSFFLFSSHFFETKLVTWILVALIGILQK